MTTEEFIKELKLYARTWAKKGAVFFQDPISKKITRVKKVTVDRLGNIILKNEDEEKKKK